jgi:energy-coupling factor transporter transmembrane protein EcfT
VVIRSCCLSPLGLCLVQFFSSLERQVMISCSPMQLDELREIEIVQHDRGINFRSCPFTRTCWIMFLAFPLVFQTREIITQAVGLFGSVTN